MIIISLKEFPFSFLKPFTSANTRKSQLKSNLTSHKVTGWLNFRVWGKAFWKKKKKEFENLYKNKLISSSKMKLLFICLFFCTNPFLLSATGWLGDLCVGE